MHYTECLDKWFKKSLWHKKEAAMLLLGTDPKERVTLEVLYEESPWKYELRFDRWTENVSYLENILIMEAQRPEDGSNNQYLHPKSVAQWAYDGKLNYWLSDSFIDYVCKHKEELKTEDCGWIDRDYASCLRKRYWTFSQCTNLLVGHQLNLKKFNIVAGNDLKDEIERALSLAIEVDEVASKESKTTGLCVQLGLLVTALHWAYLLMGSEFYIRAIMPVSCTRQDCKERSFILL